MSIPIEIETLVLCDYAADTQGRAILAGVYNGEVRLNHNAINWPQFFVHLCARPLSDRFEFLVEFMAPDGIGLMAIEVKANADKPPTEKNRLIINWQMLPLKFDGDGIYTFVVSDAKGVQFYRKEYYVTKQESEKFDLKITIEAGVNPDKLAVPFPVVPSHQSEQTEG